MVCERRAFQVLRPTPTATTSLCGCRDPGERTIASPHGPHWGPFFGVRHIVEKDGKKRTYRGHLDRWLAEVLDNRGLPISYGAPNATPHVERLVRTLREEALDHFIFLSIGHIRRVLSEFVRHYKGGRPSQASHGIPAP